MRAGSITYPMGRGRRAAPGEGISSLVGVKPLTRIANAIRPLPMGEVFNPSSLQLVSQA